MEKNTHVNCTLGLILPCWSVKINAAFAEYIGWSFSLANCHHRCRRYECGCFDVVQWPINMLLFSDYVFISFTSPVCNIKKPLLLHDSAWYCVLILLKRTDDKQSPMCQFGTHPRLAMSSISNLVVSGSIPQTITWKTGLTAPQHYTICPVIHIFGVGTTGCL